MKPDRDESAWRIRQTRWLTVSGLLVAWFSFCCSAQLWAQADLPVGNALQLAIDYGQARMVKVIGAGAGRVEGYGTGILVSPDGQILTSQGVFLDGQQTRVILADGSTHEATILRRDRELQLALLKIERPTPEFFELSNRPVGEQGDWVVALNNAFKVADKQEPVSVMLGVIALRTTMEARLNERDVAYRGELVLIDAITSNPGAAGGAVLTLDRRLVGVVGKIINSSETNTRLNYAVPVELVAAFVAGKSSESDAATRPVGKVGELGIRIMELGGRKDPAYIDRVVRGGPADQAGLKPDDLIVSIGGEKIGTVRDYLQVVARLEAGQEVIIVVKRGLELLRLPVVPAERKD
jgi:serine protease Do